MQKPRNDSVLVIEALSKSPGESVIEKCVSLQKTSSKAQE